MAIDARHLHSGIGTYVKNLLAQLAGDLGFFNTVVLAPGRHQEALRSITNAPMRTADTALYAASSQVILPFLSRDCDLLHVTNYDVPIARNKPLVVTIYDLHHFYREYAPSYAAWLYAQAMFRIAVRKAQHIITISEYSKSQIVEKLHVEESKIAIAYCGVSADFREVPKEEALSKIDRLCALSTPYILFVGNLKTHKNVTALLTAFWIMYKRGRTSHTLTIVGDDQHGRIQLKADIERLGIQGLVHWMPHIQYEFLPQLYSAADVFVLPSLTEGFGIPVLEAMACGVPVVCSRSASLPEVAGDAAEYFSPHDPEELSVVLEKVLTSPLRRSEMRKKGLSQAARFTWEGFGRKHVEVYRDILFANG